MSSVKVTALNPDNQVDVTAVQALFHATFGKDYSIPSVYDARFWHSHLGSRFFGLGVRDKNSNLLGFIAVERLPIGTIRFLYPAFHATAGDEVFTSMSERLSELANRQEWNHSHYFLNDADSSLNSKIISTLGGSLVAALPNYFASNNRLNLAFVGYRNWKKPGPILSHHVPESISPILEKLLVTCGIQKKPGTKNDISNYPLPADKLGIDITNYGDGKPTLVFIEPSLLTTPKRTVTDLAKIQSSRHFLFININDPNAIATIEALQNVGYGIGGIVPSSEGIDRLLMFKITPEALTEELLTKEAQPLVDILNSYLSKVRTDAASTKFLAKSGLVAQ